MEHYVWNKEEGVEYVTFPLLNKAGVIHGFSTKLGGVSKGIFESMNLSFTRGDDEECVMENHRRLAKAIGYPVDSLVFSDQVHDTRIRKVKKADCGKGIFTERDYEGIDGLVTDEKGITLITFYADCIPLYFYDPIKEVIAMAHSGWKGTVHRIGAVMVETMKKEYDCLPENILAVVGPGICQDCYEVSKDVADSFYHEFKEEQWADLLKKGKPGKYQLNLWKANEIILLEAGIATNHLEVSGLCTCCHKEQLFSHRATAGKRGNLAGVISLCGGISDE